MSEPHLPSAPLPPASPAPPARSSGPGLVKGIAFVVLAVALGWTAATLWQRAREEPAEGAARAVPAEWLPETLPSASELDFRLASIDGRQIGPRDFRGQVVVVDFWATWCLPCHLQAKVLAKAHEEFASQGVQMLALDVGETPETVREFVAESPFPFPVLVDPEDEVSGRFGVQVLPTLLVLDREGRIVYLRAGLVDARTLREVLKAAGA